MPTSSATLRLTKPRLRGVSHQWAFFVSVAIGAALVVVAPAGQPRLAAAIYALSVAALFGTSALYHRITWASQKARRWMRRLDHSMIFFLIAGTYTPFALLVLEGDLATVILIVVWAGALGGIFMKLVWIDAPKPLVAILYLALGWVAVAAFPDMLDKLGMTGTRAGGGGRPALHGGRARVRVRAPGPRADGLRVSRGVPRARDPRRGPAVRGDRFLRDPGA